MHSKFDISTASALESSQLTVKETENLIVQKTRIKIGIKIIQNRIRR